jgi:hypothetical protein
MGQDDRMSSLAETAPAFIEMAHRIVWCAAATTGGDGRPRSRVLHPIWEWDGAELVGWIATGPTPVKSEHLAAHPYVSCNYWEPSQDTCAADCLAEWFTDDATCERLWNRFVEAPAPVGYDPAIIPQWADGPTSEAFAALRLTPYRVRVFPGSMLMAGTGTVRHWES